MQDPLGSLGTAWPQDVRVAERARVVIAFEVFLIPPAVAEDAPLVSLGCFPLAEGVRRSATDNS